MFGDGKKLKPEIFKHYFAHLGSKKERKGTWIFPKHITASGKWLDDLWNKRQRIYHIPALLLWGMKDIAFREKELNRWIAVFEKTKVVRFEESGHFPQEEVWEPYSKALMGFMTSKTQ